jgi:hypothetical protein
MTKFISLLPHKKFAYDNLPPSILALLPIVVNVHGMGNGGIGEPDELYLVGGDEVSG